MPNREIESHNSATSAKVPLRCLGTLKSVKNDFCFYHKLQRNNTAISIGILEKVSTIWMKFLYTYFKIVEKLY